ncbi:MAG: SDR family NAD(P)-dependent oxidoreductase [Flavobacteriales bacterium]|nr:SDR family NAD(P)-dependent oxidoreductase [Flavobacteriales bacterium]
MKTFFENKVVCITGSSQGIGKTTAQILGEFGAKIVLNGRNAEKLESTRKELTEAGIECIGITADLSIAEDCQKLIDETINHFGKLDVLINNGGIASRGRISETNAETWENILKINTLGVINTTGFAIPHIQKSNGSIIIISSMAGKVGVPGHAGYSVSKMGLTAYAKALQIEHQNDFHTGLVYVGFTKNETQKQILNPDGSYTNLKERKGIKLATREDVAIAIAKTIVKRKKEITLTPLGKLQALMLRISPKLVYLPLKKSYRDYDKMYD